MTLITRTLVSVLRWFFTFWGGYMVGTQEVLLHPHSYSRTENSQTWLSLGLTLSVLAYNVLVPPRPTRESKHPISPRKK